MNAETGPPARAAAPAGKGGGTASPAPGQETMQAIVQDRYGSADVLRLEEIGRPVIGVGELVVDLEKRSVTVGGRAVSLTPHEFELLRYFAQNEGKLLTHPMILREVWGPRYGSESHYLHVYVSQLRRKIEHDPARPRYLLTEPGAGYRLVNPVAAQS